jgi:hypothetical protein
MSHTFSAASTRFSDCSRLSMVCLDIRLFWLLSFCSVRAAVRILISRWCRATSDSKRFDRNDNSYKPS